LDQVKIFSNDIVVVYYDHLLDGTPELVHEAEHLKLIDPDRIRTLCLPFTNDHLPRHFHNLARWSATENTKHDHILYLDADEIPDGAAFKELADSGQLDHYHGVDFRCHWYFRSATNQAVQTEQCGLLIRRDLVIQDCMFTEHERWIYRHIPDIKYMPLVSGPSGPLLHHYSWVRTKQEMLTKVGAWGHRYDKDWVSLVEQEFLNEFNGTDFVHGYSYQQVQDRFDIGL